MHKTVQNYRNVKKMHKFAWSRGPCSTLSGTGVDASGIWQYLSWHSNAWPAEPDQPNTETFLTSHASFSLKETLPLPVHMQEILRSRPWVCPDIRNVIATCGIGGEQLRDEVANRLRQGAD